MRPFASFSSGAEQPRAPTVTDAAGARPPGMRLAVLGSPIAHSKSPALHAAAYSALGLDWNFRAVEVREGETARFFETLDASWRGLAVTMPLKREVMQHLDEIDAVAQRVGAVNTVLFDHGRRFGFNTDVYGVTRALGELGVTAPHRVVLIGAGATAASVVVAVAGMGARELLVVARAPERAAAVLLLAESVGLTASVAGLSDAIDGRADVVISTLPGGTTLGDETINAFAPASFRTTTPLFDVTYGPAHSELVNSWNAAGGTSANGLGMLLYQAVQQVRVFTGGGPNAVLDDENAVIESMKSALDDAASGHTRSPAP